MNRYLILLCDEDAGVWTIAMSTEDRAMAHTEYEELKADRTPAIMIFTGDFVTV